MAGLTPRQADTARAIEDLSQRLGHSPSLQEVAAELGLKSKGNACRLVARLRERGWLKPAPANCARRLELSRPAPRPIAGDDRFEVTDAGLAAMAHFDAVESGNEKLAAHLAERLSGETSP